MNKHAARRLVLLAVKRAGFAQVTYADRAIRQIDKPSPSHLASEHKAAHKSRGHSSFAGLLINYWSAWK